MYKKRSMLRELKFHFYYFSLRIPKRKVLLNEDLPEKRVFSSTSWFGFVINLVFKSTFVIYAPVPTARPSAEANPELFLVAHSTNREMVFVLER